MADNAAPVSEFNSHDAATEYIDRVIETQVALGYDAPTAVQRSVAIEQAELAILRLRRLT